MTYKSKSITPPKVLIRLDSGGRFGLGHLIRSKALVDALINFDCTFVVKQIHANNAVSPHQLIFINNENEFLAMAKNVDIVIIDHYDYSEKLFYKLSQLIKPKLIILDDECNRGNLYADIIINPISPIKSFDYERVAPKAKLLLGPEYIILRELFQPKVSLVNLLAFEQRNSIIITFGGSDITEITLAVLKQIATTSLTRFNIIVITGAGCNHINQIDDYCKVQGFSHCHNVKNMAELFSKAKFAISAAGSTVFELASLGVPAVFAVVADNQIFSIQDQVQYGWCSMIDCRLQNKADELVLMAEKIINEESLEQLSHIAQTIVDGQGATRVALEISKMLAMDNLVH